MVLEKESEYFAANKKDLLTHYAGKYALIKGDEFRGAFDTMEAAFNEGIDEFGVAPFMIKHIVEKEEVEKIPALTHHLINANS